jgi:eukaryotic-like serine/threonine-protein kinase
MRAVAAHRFELIRELGSGSTGTVWRAWDHHRGAQVAVKILHQFDAALMRRFKHEFRTLADLRHSNIVRFQELFEVDDRLFFSMELLEGVDLLTWIWGYQDHVAISDDDDRRGQETQPHINAILGPKVDYQRLRDVFAQLISGLAELHAAGILHRDLKPSNLMVDRNGHLMILDFGLAVSSLATRDQELRSAVGTIAYMAPEIAQQCIADARADYYSIGVLLFEAMTGRTPFPGERIAEVLTAKITEDPPAASSLVPDVPADLDALCSALLCRDPERRAGAADLTRGFRRDLLPVVDGELLAHGSGAIVRPAVVGRHGEVARLLADLENVRSDGLQCRLVIGPSGIGKSALAEAFTRLLPADAVVLKGRCHDREAIPFRAIDEVVDALSHHLATLSDRARAGLIPAHAELLAELFPVLRGIGGIDGQRGRPRRAAAIGAVRAQAFAALRQLFTAVARNAPLAVVIDDLHLADPDSIELLTEVFRGVDPPPLLLIGLGRPGAVMEQLCQQASPDSRATLRLDLGPLHGEEAESVARSMAHYMDIALVDAYSLAIDTRGHPGFTLEVLRSAASGHGPPGNLPALESVLAKHVYDLPEPSRRVLELLSVAGGLLSVALAADVLGYSVGNLAAALDDLVDADLVVATGRSLHDAFEFYHERIREVVAATLSVEALTAINHALAEGLERRGVIDPQRLLRHWHLGREPAKAAHYRTVLAGAAAAEYEFQRAALLHETTLRDALPIDLECRVRSELAAAYSFLGRHSDSAAEYLAAARLAGPQPALELQRLAAEALLSAGDIESGSALIEDVIAALGAAAPRQRGWQLATAIKHSVAHALFGDRFAARDRATIAPAPAVLLEALATATIGVGVLDPLRSRIYQQRHLAIARQVGDSVRYCRAICAEATWHAARGNRQRARVAALLDRAGAVAAEAGEYPDRDADLLLGRAMTGFLLGDFSDAHRAIEGCLASLLPNRTDSGWKLRQARCYAAWLYWMTGDYAALRGRVPVWADQAKQRGDRFTVTLMTTATSIEAWLLDDDIAGTERGVEDSERACAALRAPVVRWQIAAARAHLELYRGNPAKALATLVAAEPAARRAGLHRVEVLRIAMLHLHLRVRLAMATATGSSSHPATPAAHHLARAAQLIGELAASPAPRAQALAGLALATHLESSGQPQLALARYRDCQRQLRAVALHGYADAAQWRAAHLLGGVEGSRQRDAMMSASAAHGIRNPSRFFAHLVGA